MNREVVKTDSAITRIPELDFEIPAFTQKGCEYDVPALMIKENPSVNRFAVLFASLEAPMQCKLKHVLVYN